MSSGIKNILYYIHISYLLFSYFSYINILLSISLPLDICMGELAINIVYRVRVQLVFSYGWLEVQLEVQLGRLRLGLTGQHRRKN
jgi:hypothetical protein